MAAIVLDLDHFKRVNDTLGHTGGDEVLQRTARVLDRHRSLDLVGRLGGEEFLVLAPYTDEHEAHVLAERLRLGVAREFTDLPVPVTASAGIAAYPKHGRDPEQVGEAADMALYEAKAGGRDRTVIATERMLVQSRRLRAVSAAGPTGLPQRAASADSTSAAGPGPRVRTLVVDDKEQIRDAVAELLDGEPGIEVVGVAAGVAEAVELAGERHPDVALVDVRMPDGGGPAATRGILDRSPSTRVISFSASHEEASVMAMLESGACAYLLKSAPAGELIDTIRRAPQGEGRMSAEVTAGMVERLSAHLSDERERAEASDARERRVRAVLGGAGLSIVFQPAFDLPSGETIAFEALARFDAEPRRPPDEWFAEAAEAGLGLELELFAVGMALSRLPDLPEGMLMSVNVSPATAVSAELAALVLGSEPGRIVLEVTEHAPIEDYAAFSQGVAGMRASGALLAVDDAGAGFASLRHIINLDPDRIKLDRTLTSGIDRDPRKRALAAALLKLSDELGAKIVAEGIETESELATLRGLGVTRGQGYLLARPGPLPGRSGRPAATSAAGPAASGDPR